MARKTRADWLEQGLQQLVAHGPEAVTIEAMCQIMQVTKGSFYHHFENQPAFLEALLQHWEDHYTTRFISESQAEARPLEQLQRLSAQVIANHDASETVIRAWAITSPLARAYQERVDARRLGYLQKLWADILQDTAQADVMANIMYSLLIGAQSMVPPLTREALTQMFSLLETAFNHTLSKEKD